MSKEKVSKGKVSEGKESKGEVSKGKVSEGKVSEGRVFKRKVSNGKLALIKKWTLIPNITYYVANLKLDSIDISQYDYQMQFEFP